ncbi:MAG TPA: hypothetical protein VLS89_13580, partial [Candidatus Nanopelagicales bacterium]|nr:hypothetical protein [Candidatus Nanopelagicales bacterium]
MGEGAESDPLFAEEDDAPPLDFNVWMDLSAQRVQREPEERAAILGRAGVKEADWEAADERWTKAMFDDVNRGDMKRAEAY